MLFTNAMEFLKSTFFRVQRGLLCAADMICSPRGLTSHQTHGTRTWGFLPSVALNFLKKYHRSRSGSNLQPHTIKLQAPRLVPRLAQVWRPHQLLRTNLTKWKGTGMTCCLSLPCSPCLQCFLCHWFRRFTHTIHRHVRHRWPLRWRLSPFSI